MLSSNPSSSQSNNEGSSEEIMLRVREGLSNLNQAITKSKRVRKMVHTNYVQHKKIQLEYSIQLNVSQALLKRHNQLCEEYKK
jgi:hypothetical protein